MPVRGIDHQRIHSGIDERDRPVQEVRAGTDCTGHPQPAVAILVGVRVLAPLVDVLDGDQPAQQALTVHHGELLDPVLAQNALRLVERRPFRSGDQPVLGHHLAQRAVELALELQIPICDDPHQLSFAVDDRHPGDLEPLHQRARFAQRRVRRESDRVEDHPALRALDPVDLRRLTIDRHVLVDDADPARPRHGDRHRALGHRIHRRRHERNIQSDAAREVRSGGNVLGMHLGMPGCEQHVIECER